MGSCKLDASIGGAAKGKRPEGIVTGNDSGRGEGRRGITELSGRTIESLAWMVAGALTCPGDSLRGKLTTPRTGTFPAGMSKRMILVLVFRETGGRGISVCCMAG